MHPFTFVHAADLHLDAPFRGVSLALEDSANSAAQPHRRSLQALFSRAGFTALERLTEVCLACKADFLLLAGDIYNAAEGSLRARLALRDAFLRLEQAGIAVFLVKGNHDPFSSETTGISWPANVVEYDSQMSTHTALRSGEPLALVHGISHATEKEGRNLAHFFSRSQEPSSMEKIFQIGLLHCALDGQEGIHAKYAPCSLPDLVATQLDYWALGHVHSPQIIRQSPICVVYPGSTQGLHVNESGPHGCMVVQVDKHGVANPTLMPLAPVQWEHLTFTLDAATENTPEDIVALESLILKTMQELAQRITEGQIKACTALALPAAIWPSPALIARVTLSGRTALHHELRQPGALTALQQHLEESLRTLCAEGNQEIWIRDIIPATRPTLDIDTVGLRPDLIGEVVRVARALQSAEQQDEHEAHNKTKLHLPDALLGELFFRTRLREDIAAPDKSECNAIIEEATLLCLDLLEGK